MLKKSTPIAAAATIMLSAGILPGCTKFSADDVEQLPAAIRGGNAALLGMWDIINVESIPDVDGSFEFLGNGMVNFEYSYTYDGYSYNYSYTGSWNLLSGGEVLNLNFGGGPVIYDIQKLTRQDLWMEDEQANLWTLEKI